MTPVGDAFRLRLVPAVCRRLARGGKEGHLPAAALTGEPQAQFPTGRSSSCGSHGFDFSSVDACADVARCDEGRGRLGFRVGVAGGGRRRRRVAALALHDQRLDLRRVVHRDGRSSAARRSPRLPAAHGSAPAAGLHPPDAVGPRRRERLRASLPLGRVLVGRARAVRVVDAQARVGRRHRDRAHGGQHVPVDLRRRSADVRAPPAHRAAAAVVG